jgi:hypothetical protein
MYGYMAADAWCWECMRSALVLAVLMGVCVCGCLFAGCPLILTDMDVVEKSESLSKPEREFLCGLLFQTINWFREVTTDLS